jgi:tRNA-specific 2-thiouridylase
MNCATEVRGKSVIAAMSGGVDSSVAAARLVEAGASVVGATMKLFDNDALACDAPSGCCSLEDVEDARLVCLRLGVEHFTFNFKGAFGRDVMDKFCTSYIEGRTPNPCIDCNRYLKFEALQRRRVEMNADFVATGHYARTRYNDASGRFELLRAVDGAKDQSYVLYHLTQDQLAHMVFPLGELTKPEVRELARALELETAEKPESQDICFVPDGNYAAFIQNRFGERSRVAFEPGEIVDMQGRVLGQHQGLVYYTPGQRKGIGVAAPAPLYVFAKDVVNNRLVVGFKDEVCVRGVRIGDVNFVSAASFEAGASVQVKTHYRSKMVDARVYQYGKGDTCELEIIFDEPQMSCAPGQAAVLYEGEKVLAGGTILKSI